MMWAVSTGLITAASILESCGHSSDGMSGLQALAIISALPWTFVMVGIVWSMFKSLHGEVRAIEKIELRLRQQELVSHVTGAVSQKRWRSTS